MAVLMTAAVLASSTSYCLRGTMADGTTTRWGSVASNRYRLGTPVHIDEPFYGRRRFVVRDRIGWGSELDLWAPACAMSLAWGRRAVHVRPLRTALRVGRARRLLGRRLPRGCD